MGFTFGTSSQEDALQTVILRLSTIVLTYRFLSGIRRLFLPERYIINGSVRYWHLYLFSDVIYPNWTIFVKQIAAPMNERDKLFSEKQLSVCKDF